MHSDIKILSFTAHRKIPVRIQRCHSWRNGFVRSMLSCSVFLAEQCKCFSWIEGEIMIMIIVRKKSIVINEYMSRKIPFIYRKHIDNSLNTPYVYYQWNSLNLGSAYGDLCQQTECSLGTFFRRSLANRWVSKKNYPFLIRALSFGKAFTRFRLYYHTFSPYWNFLFIKIFKIFL